MPRALKGVALTFLILSFFCLMSRIDYIVHRVLYDYGLIFSYEWANDYWIAYNLTFLAFATIVSFSYWIGSDKTAKNRRFSILLFVTINALAIGGLQDIMFFTFWAGGLPPVSVVWWWAPWINVFGTWTSLTQVSLTTLIICGTIFTWLLAAKEKNPDTRLRKMHMAQTQRTR